MKDIKRREFIKMSTGAGFASIVIPGASSETALRFMGGNTSSALFELWQAGILNLRGVPIFPLKYSGRKMVISNFWLNKDFEIIILKSRNLLHILFNN